MKLSPTTLDWALVHLTKYSDTDKFPSPFEIGVISRQWTTSVRTHLENIDLTNHRWQGERKMLVPKDLVSFRNAAQLDPIDALLLAGLMYDHGISIEVKRRPVSESNVFSYRFAPTSDGTLFSLDRWDAFWETSIRRARTCLFVLMVDITDFYNQISHHSIENQLKRCDLPAPAIKVLMNLVKKCTGSISKGIPVGPHPTHLLAEASLIPIDELLMQRGFPFCRYVDDIHVFCESYEDAQVALFALAGALDQYHKLTLNRSKTKLMPSDEFLRYAKDKVEDQPINQAEKSVLAVIKTHAAGPYTAIPVSRLSPDELRVMTKEALELILTAYLEVPEPDYIRLRYFLRRLAQVGVPGAVDFLVSNLPRMLPAFAEIASYLHAATSQYNGNWIDLGEDLLGLLESPIAKESEYLQIAILGLFARIGKLNHIGELTKRFSSSAASAQREIILAACNVGADSWLRTIKNDYSRYDPWNRRALAYASRILPEDEREYFIKDAKKISNPLELAILADSDK